MIKDYNQIQPLRIYEDLAGMQQHDYYEKNHFNIKHSLVYASDERFIPFSFDIPTNLINISSCKLYCANESTVVFDIIDKLVNADNLKIVSYTNQMTGIVGHRVMFQCSEGFTTNINGKLCYLKIIVNNPATAETKTFRSDFVQIIVTTTGVIRQILELIPTEFTSIFGLP